jgi:membrane-associated phospholipid phosphatase
VNQPWVVCLAVTTLGLSLSSPAEARNVKTWGRVSDVGAYGLTALAVGLPAVKGDTKGALQAAGSVAAASLIATGLKEAFPETRPDGSNRKSFPSGHTSNAFAAATTLYQRQGASIGIPAFAVAALVGVARVQADKHHWYDCVAGAGIGMAAGFLITHRHPESRAALVPWGDTKEAGLTFAMRF